MNFNEIWTGARWWKFDIQTHTPASDDYPIKTDSPEEWLIAYMKAGIDCVAITDHNSGDWVDKLKQTYLHMQQSNPSGFGYFGVTEPCVSPNESHALGK
ncbi:MAG: hypothetical protein Q8M98_03795 [Candidatus Cloacimonadaceae bacterium]|nr:hypothetical protein [Candidatus Cloacimonadaceae bacterium]